MKMEKTAVLLANLGTPDTSEVKDVRSYLKQFLSDPRVIDTPRWKWLPVLHGIVLRTRPKKSAALYESIWTEQGSPLLIHTEQQQLKLQERLQNDHIKVVFAMTYGNPSIASELHKLHEWGVRRLIIIPLFPQYSSTTTAPVWDQIQKKMSTWRDIPSITFVRDYPDHPKFIDYLVYQIQTTIEEKGTPDALILSYHGIPLHYANTGDDYPIQCQKTTDNIKLHFPQLKIIQTYQSKFGNDPWLEPATDDIVKHLAATGHKHIFIMSPAFTADCLETLEELEMENAQYFKENGGEHYDYLPAANDHPLFIDCLEDLVRKYIN